MKNEEKNSKLNKIALSARKSCIKMSAGGGCFLGASLSCVDILTFLYCEYLNVNLNNLKSPDRDYLFLSKGHDVPALYSIFAELGFISKERLNNHLSTEDYLYWHPNTNIPGVEFHSGSLGHLASVAIGVALDCKKKNAKNKIIVILGDGELNEGSVWEAFLFASTAKLNNLIFVIDRNFFQANKRTEELIQLEPLKQKFEAFGILTQEINGHSFDELRQAFEFVDNNKSFEKPFAIIARTKRGKGLPSIEERADRWFCKFTNDEVNQLLLELENDYIATIQSETIIAR